ncbi:MAG: hypothetical protein ABUJ92_02560 [Desulfobacterales bacterium]
MNRANSLVIWLLTVALLFNIIFSSHARADRLNFHSEFTYDNSDNETTDKTTGQAASSMLSSFNQKYNLDFSKTIYPYLTLAGGTFYNLNNSTFTSQATETESEQKTLRPFAKLDLKNPLYRAGMGFRRMQIESKTTGTPATQDFRDEINTILGWKPEGLPESNLRYVHTHAYNDFETVDSIEKQLTFITSYLAWKELDFKYFYTRSERENNIDGSEALDQNHNGNINYSHNFFNSRLSLSTGYKIRYNTFEFSGTGSGDFALLRSAGLWSLDDTPEDGPALALNPALIDGNLTASSGIDIGLGGDETTLTNIGLDFGFSVNVDRIRVWVDRSLTTPIADTFSWLVYTSPDNTDTSTWTLQATVSPASFGVFENRFEISFPAANTRFVKVVTRPLSPVVPDAALFPNIFVTEMQAFTTLSGASGQNKAAIVDHNYNLNLRGKLSDKAVLGYNLFYRLQEQDPSSEKRTELSNGVNLNYIFNRVFSGSTSFSRIDYQSTDEKSVRDDYAASLRAAYLDTLGQALTYSGTKITEADGSSSRNSLFLRTNANLLRGWSAYLDTGYSWEQPSDSAQTTSTIIRSGTNIVPNDKITINMDYSRTQTNGQTPTSRWDIGAFFIPFRALSFDVRLRMQEQGNSKTTLYNYSANWAPFSDGALQFFFTYDEMLRPEDDRKSRTIGPSLKWALGRHFFLDMFYNITETEDILQTTDSNKFNASLRIIF